MKMKATLKQRKRKPAAQRQTPAKGIAAEPDLFLKMNLAADMTLLDWPPRKPILAKAELAAFVGMCKRAHWLRLDPRIPANSTFMGRSKLPGKLAEIGQFICERIADCDFKFFGKLAAAMQFPHAAEPHELYRDILRFCVMQKCGTAATPCDTRKLTAFLEHRGHRFAKNYVRDIPLTLRPMCKKLGVVLVPASRGRPTDNSRR